MNTVLNARAAGTPFTLAALNAAVAQLAAQRGVVDTAFTEANNFIGSFNAAEVARVARLWNGRAQYVGRYGLYFARFNPRIVAVPPQTFATPPAAPAWPAGGWPWVGAI